MSNPWLKKNPWLSMWMSGANTVASHARAQAKAETRRTIDQGMKDSIDFWTKAWFPNVAPPAAPKRKRRR
jgi:hypothetical protein